MGRVRDLGRLFLTSPLTRLADLLNASAPPPREERVQIYREALLQAAQLGRPRLRASLQVSLAQELLDDRSRSRAESLEEAIERLDEAARIFREEGLPIPWAEACTSLAIAFLERIRGPRQENLEAALRFCRRALQVQSRRSRPAAWAEVADCLASALAARARIPRAIYLEKSVDLFRRALAIRKRAPDPAGWVSTSIHLASILNERIQGDRAESLEEAIGLLRNAEQALLGQNATSPQWAIVQNNLAVMYRDRLRGDSTANREQAIDILSALLSQPQHLPPIDRGRALHLLAALHVERTRGRRAENLERAIALYQQALEIHTREDLPQRWAETTQNLATAYAERLEGDPARNLERAIALYHQVLDQIDRQQAPEDWAVAASNLATACSDRLEGDCSQNLQEAVALYRQVLEVRRETDPRGQALTQMNLGNTFARLEIGGEPGAFEAAQDVYRQALEVHQISTLPGEHRRTQGNLADLFFARQSWQEALQAYRSALAAGEILYRSSATPEARRAILRANLDYFLRAAWCLARLGRPAEALELLERSRTRSLNEALDLTEALLQRLPASLRTALATTRERIASLEAQSRRLGPDEREEFLRITEAIGRQRAHLEEVLERVRTDGLDVLPAGMNAADVVALASELDTAVVYLITTPHGSLGLLARPAAKEIESFFLDQFRQEHLRALLQGGNGAPSFLECITHGDAPSLRMALDHVSPALQGRLVFPLAAQLAQRGLVRVCVIACGSLGSLPLTALAPEGLVLHLSPSARALESARLHRQHRDEMPPCLLAVGDPRTRARPLPFAVLEAREISGYFPEDRRRILSASEATFSSVQEEMPGATHLHLSCHGRFQTADPLTSSLELSGNEPLLLRDLLDGRLDLSAARLVVLSACQTGITDQELPDEALGFPAAFLQAGVPATVSTLWPVDDAPTAFLLIRFYQYHLVEHMEPAVALREAQRWLRTATARELRLVEYCEYILEKMKGTPNPTANLSLRRYRQRPEAIPFEHPSCWAGFVVTGM